MKLISSLLTVLLAPLALTAPAGDAARFEDSLVDALSMPDLVGVPSPDKLGDWQMQGSCQLHEGRIVLTPKPMITSNDKKDTEITYGSLWSRPVDGTSALAEFETQVTLRSLGSAGRTGAGFSLWLVADDDKTVQKYTQNNFGGPSQYTGLQISLDANDKSLGPVLRVFFNDGSKQVSINDDYIGAWHYAYQASDVPLTIKVGYSDKWIKVTCDNKLLFESTDQLQLSSIFQSKHFRVGLTADSPQDIRKNEQFEVLRIKSYAKVSADLRAECKQTLRGAHAGSGVENEPVVKKVVVDAPKTPETSGVDSTLLETINEKLADIQQKLAEQPQVVADGQGGVNLDATLQKHLADLTQAMNKLTHNVNNVLRKSELANERSEVLERKYDHLQELLGRQQQLLENAELSSKSLGKSFQQEIQKMGANIDSKVSSIHESYSEKLSKGTSNPELEARLQGLASFIKMVLLPLVLICTAIAVLVFRLRSDIQHSKVL